MMKYEICLSDALAKLVEAAGLIGGEISDYPTPIAGCNEHFNRLIEGRARQFGR